MVHDCVFMSLGMEGVVMDRDSRVGALLENAKLDHHAQILEDELESMIKKREEIASNFQCEAHGRVELVHFVEKLV